MSPLSIVITIVVIVLILMLLKYIFADPYTLQNIQSGQTASTINSSSLATNGSDIPSTNFGYSVWFYVNDWNYRYGEPKVIFGRMGSKSQTGSSENKYYLGLIPISLLITGNFYLNMLVGFSSILFLFIYSIIKIRESPLLYLWILLFILEYTKVWSLASLS